MIFDHNEILEMAYERLKRRVKHRPYWIRIAAENSSPLT
jgi:hypothetical protein